MIAHVSQIPEPASDSNAVFTEMLPSILTSLRREFRKLDEDRREDAIHEAVANCFVAFRRLVERGRATLAYPTVLARYAAAQVREGRLVAGALNANDVSSRYAQIRRGIRLQNLEHFDEHRREWREAVINDPKTPVFHQVSFRLDFPAWLLRLTSRDRKVALALATGGTTAWVARKFKLSAARVSQLRGELRDSWHEFHAGAERARPHFPAV